jgi:signal recognition particle subunit SRP54
VEYYFRLPEKIEGKRVLVVDPLLATGDTALATIERIKQYGVKEVRMLTVCASVTGLTRMAEFHPELAQNKPDEKQMGRVEAIISAMTPGERRNEKIINGSRRKRIAAGSGTSVEDVNRLLKQFVEMKRVLQMIGQGQMPGMKGAGGMRQRQQAQQALRQGGHGMAMPGKKRTTGGPWGLIKAR